MPSTEFFTVLGAAGVAIWVLWMVITGRLHADSEVENLKVEILGHRQDKLELLKENKELRDINSEVAPLLRDILRLLQLEEEETP